MDKCQHNLKENPQTHSVYCEKLEQWISIKYCDICRHHECIEPKTSTNNIISLSITDVSKYVPTYVRLSTYTKTKTHQNTPNPNLHSNKILLCGVLA